MLGVVGDARLLTGSLYDVCGLCFVLLLLRLVAAVHMPSVWPALLILGTLPFAFSTRLCFLRMKCK